MGRIQLYNFSQKLIEYLSGLGFTEEQALEIINNIKNIVIGDLATLMTNEKSNVVSAINDILTKKDDVKQKLIAALIVKGVTVDEQQPLEELVGLVNDIKTSQGDATENDVLSGKTFTSNASSELQTGAIPIRKTSAYSVTPAKSNKTLNSGYYGGDITIKGDSNLIASNIKKGVNIFGVTGTKVFYQITAGSEITVQEEYWGPIQTRVYNYPTDDSGYDVSNWELTLNSAITLGPVPYTGYYEISLIYDTHPNNDYADTTAVFKFKIKGSDSYTSVNKTVTWNYVQAAPDVTESYEFGSSSGFYLKAGESVTITPTSGELLTNNYANRIALPYGDLILSYSKVQV